MKARFFLLVSVLVITVSSCQKEKVLDKSSIVGSWEWIYSMEGWNGIQTPESKGYTQSVEFKSNGIYRMYRNGQLQEEQNYSLGQDSSFLTRRIEKMIQFEGGYKEIYSLSSDGDSLFMGTSVVDGESSIYIRK